MFYAFKLAVPFVNFLFYYQTESDYIDIDSQLYFSLAALAISLFYVCERIVIFAFVSLPKGKMWPVMQLLEWSSKKWEYCEF